ncbi:MAG TPA: YciI family protein [Burkholderiaceae bacterium]
MSDPTELSDYLVLSCGQWDADASKEDIQAAIDQFYLWYERLVAQGTIKRGQRLAPERKTVSRRGVVDGPFAETKEIIGGYWVIVAASLQQAAEIASRNPCLAYGLSYEIGPIEPARASAYDQTCETPLSRA